MMEQTNLTSRGVSVLNTHGIDDQITVIFTWIIYTVICQALEIFGITTNAINIMCFVKQGFKDPVNISLLGLAVSDLGCLITMIWINISFTPAFTAAELPFEVLEVFYLVAAMPHATFSRVSSSITAMITVERCLCIIAPLKVKAIVTPKRVTFIIVTVFIVMIACAAPVYLVNKLGMKLSPARNKTLVGLISTIDRENVEKMYFAINSFFLPLTAFVIIIISTVILVLNLESRTKWRKMSTTATLADVTRSQKVAKMVVVISTLYIVCFTPISIVFLALVFEPELSIGGKLVNIGIVAGGFGVLLETINSSVNIFIYYSMSTNYRDAFRNIFCRHDATKKSFL